MAELTTIHEFDLGKGLDARSSENQIPAGYSEEAVNANFTETRVEKRKGYEQVGGYVPIRAELLQITNNNGFERICVTLDSSIDVTRLPEQPVRLRGTADIEWDSVAAGTLADKWYEQFVVILRQVGTATISPASHGFDAATMLVGATESTSQTNLSNSILIPDNVTISKAAGSNTLDQGTTFTFTEVPGPASTPYIPYFYNATPALAGSAAFEAPNLAAGSNTINIATSTIGLDGVALSDLRNFNYIVQVFKMDVDTFSAATSLELVIPDDIRIASNGDLAVDVSTQVAGDDFLVVVHAPAAANTLAGTAESVTGPNSGVTSVTFSSEDAFLFTSIYTFNTSTNEKEVIIPDSIVFDDTTKTHTITFTNTSETSVGFEVYYVAGSLQVNEICLDTTVPAAGSDGDLLRQSSGLEMDVYGLDPEGLFVGESRGGWVHHIDSYRTGTTNELIIGSGGVFYTQALQGYADLLPRTSVTATEPRTIAPAFQETGSTVNRTRGAVRFDNGTSNFAEVESVTHISGTTVEYLLKIPNSDLGSVAISDIIVPGKDDITVSQMGYSVHNGTFEVQSIVYNENIADKSLDTLVIQVSNPDVSDDSFDEVDAGGLGGIFTDVFDIPGSSSTIELFPGDGVEGGTLPIDTLTVKYADNTNLEVVLSGVTSEISISDGVTIFGQRTSSVVPVISGLTDTFVPGDMLTYTGHSRLNRVKKIRTQANTACTISGDTITISDISGLEVGQAIAILTDDVDGGIYTISSVIDSTTFTIDTVLSSTTGIVMGNSIVLDEELEYRGTIDQSIRFSSTTQWQAIEHPISQTSFDRISGNLTHRYLDVNPFENQPFVRSAPVNNTLYFTNGFDEVLKYDGLNVLQAGLARWEGGMIATPINIGTGTLLAGNYGYYVRLSYLDRNGNIIGSAAHGSEGDFLVQLSSDSDVSLKIAIPPVYGNLDYSNLQIEIYRTKQDGAVFFFLNSLAVSYASGDEYVTYVDTDLDLDLIESDPLEIVAATPPNRIEAPLRAKYLTSANNRLVLGNLSDYPQIDLQIRRKSALTLASFDGLDVTIADSQNSQTFRFTSSTGTAVSAIGSSSFTVADATGIEVGGIIYAYQTAAGNSADHLGYFKVTGVTGTLIEVAQAFDTATPSAIQIIGVSGKVPVFLGDDHNFVPNLQNPPGVTGLGVRLSRAVNAAASIDSPIVLASGDLNFSRGQIIFRQMQATTDAVTVTVDDTDSLALTGASQVATLFVDGIRAQFTGSEYSKSLSTITYPSRLLISAQSNFPELFDNIRAVSDADSQSIIDVNSADGQEITGVIPFFGESTSQDSRKQDIVIVFKTNSIYAVDIKTGTINKIDSRGIGCTVPFSIGSVPNGLIFANESGIYRLNRSYDVIWVGRMVDRKWKSEVNQEQLGIMHGHIYPEEQQYKLSYAVPGDSENTEVLVYDYGDEGEGQSGNWSQYNNHQATGWANLLSQAFFGTSKGRVYSVRKRGDETDFRDDDQPIEFAFTYRALHFGDPGRRKIVRRIISNFRVLVDSENSSLQIATDLDRDFRATSSFKIDASQATDGLSDIISDKVLTIRHSLPIQKGVYFQLRYTNDGKDEPIEIAGISFVLTGLTDAGITEAGDT